MAMQLGVRTLRPHRHPGPAARGLRNGTRLHLHHPEAPTTRHQSRRQESDSGTGLALASRPPPPSHALTAYRTGMFERARARPGDRKRHRRRIKRRLARRGLARTHPRAAVHHPQQRRHPSPLHHAGTTATDGVPAIHAAATTRRGWSIPNATAIENATSATTVRIDGPRPGDWCEGAGNDGDDMRDETENFLVLDTRPHALLIHQKKSPSCRVVRAFGWECGGPGGGRVAEFHHINSGVYGVWTGVRHPFPCTRLLRKRNP